LQGRTAEEIFGPVDALKLRSSMTLFTRARPGEAPFGEVIDRYFGGRPDAATDELLGRAFAQVGAEVRELARRCAAMAPRVAAVLEGGYELETLPGLVQAALDGFSRKAKSPS